VNTNRHSLFFYARHAVKFSELKLIKNVILENLKTGFAITSEMESAKVLKMAGAALGKVKSVIRWPNLENIYKANFSPACPGRIMVFGISTIAGRSLRSILIQSMIPLSENVGHSIICSRSGPAITGQKKKYSSPVIDESQAYKQERQVEDENARF